MKKLVNGKVIDIKNLDIFENGFEGMAMNRLVVSNINNELAGEPDVVRVCVEEYNRMYRSLPFPLYAVESNVRYAAMATYIMDRAFTLIGTGIDMWVDKAIFVPLADERALKIVGNTWGIVQNYDAKKYTQLTDEQIASTNIETYKDENGYEEFKWCLTQIMNGKSMTEFYRKFVRGFEEACLGEGMVMKWELGRMLDFGHLPEREETEINTIKNTLTGKIYQIDVFWTGKMRKTTSGEHIMVLDLTTKNSPYLIKDKEEKEYNYDIYEITNGLARKKLKAEKLAFSGLLFAIVKKGKDADRVERVSYTGLTDGEVMAFDIEGSTYVGNVGAELIEIGNGVELWNIENSKIYMKKSLKKASGVMRICYYAYDIKTQKLKLCKIEYK